jgi:hypothetical protein
MHSSDLWYILLLMPYIPWTSGSRTWAFATSIPTNVCGFLVPSHQSVTRYYVRTTCPVSPLCSPLRYRKVQDDLSPKIYSGITKWLFFVGTCHGVVMHLLVESESKSMRHAYQSIDLADAPYLPRDVERDIRVQWVECCSVLVTFFSFDRALLLTYISTKLIWRCLIQTYSLRFYPTACR